MKADINEMQELLKGNDLQQMEDYLMKHRPASLEEMTLYENLVNRVLMLRSSKSEETEKTKRLLSNSPRNIMTELQFSHHSRRAIISEMQELIKSDNMKLMADYLMTHGPQSRDEAVMYQALRNAEHSLRTSESGETEKQRKRSSLSTLG